MKWLLDENGNIVMRNGKPVAIGNDGKEFEYDVAERNDKFVATVAEAVKHKKEKQALQTQMDGIPEGMRTNPDGFIDLSTVDVKTKEGIEAVRTELQTSFDSAAKVKDDRIAELTGQLHFEKVDSRFASSKALDNTIFNKTRSIAASHFGSQFSVNDEGKVIGKNANGETIYSSENPGQPADFDTALGIIINTHPDKDNLLAPSGQRGGGNPPRDGNGNPAPKTSQEKIKAGIEARRNASN